LFDWYINRWRYQKKFGPGIELDDSVTNVMFTNFRYIDNNIIDVDAIRRLRMANVTLLPVWILIKRF
jgi:hypothetical protein